MFSEFICSFSMFSLSMFESYKKRICYSAVEIILKVITTDNFLRLAVRLLQCASPASNSHSSKFHQSNKISFLFGDANNRPISSNDSKTIKVRVGISFNL